MPDELRIYLVDFKRGVEFKIYADYELPAFKVIAIESEREFGYNILLALEREQKIRANLFKKNHVDRIEEYRDTGEKLPRILVIMENFMSFFPMQMRVRKEICKLRNELFVRTCVCIHLF